MNEQGLVMHVRRITWTLGLLLLLLAMVGKPGHLSASEVDVAGGAAVAGHDAQAGLVIQFGDGQTEIRCVAFEGDEISGADLLLQSDLGVIVDVSSGMGITVCQIARQGCAFPAEPCFCQCMGGGECAYWNYFYLEPGEKEWTYSALGAAMRQVRSGSVEAWVWGDGHIPPASEVTFEEICVPEAPTVEPTEPPTALPTAEPTANSASPPPRPSVTAAPSETLSLTQSPTPSPTNLPTTTVAQPSASPVPAVQRGQDLSSYWPFGLAVAGLAMVGAVAWLRRK
jgi:hypothetical protein